LALDVLTEGWWVPARALDAVLFDLGGTLDAPGIPWKERLFRLYRAEGVVIPPDDFATLFYRADDALVGAVPAALSLRDTVQRLVDGISAALNVDDTRLTDRIATQFLERATTCARDNARLLSDLASRYRLGIVSNFYGNLVTVCDELGLRSHLGVIVDSSAVGWTKPDPRIFQRALDGLGVKAGDAAFVGDSLPRDMAGARAVGMAHIWLVEEAVSPPAPCCPDDRIIHSLDELRDVLL
jgi:HAD superfamily hydrolase (TIGR01549 family)